MSSYGTNRWGNHRTGHNSSWKKEWSEDATWQSNQLISFSILESIEQRLNGGGEDTNCVVGHNFHLRSSTFFFGHMFPLDKFHIFSVASLLLSLVSVKTCERSAKNSNAPFHRLFTAFFFCWLCFYFFDVISRHIDVCARSCDSWKDTERIWTICLNRKERVTSALTRLHKPSTSTSQFSRQRKIEL